MLPLIAGNGSGDLELDSRARGSIETGLLKRLSIDSSFGNVHACTSPYQHAALAAFAFSWPELNSLEVSVVLVDFSARESWSANFSV